MQNEPIELEDAVELEDADLDLVAGGGPFDFNNFQSNQGTQQFGLGAFNNLVPNEGTQIGIGIVVA